MMKTQTETFRGYGKICELNAQTAVECRFGGEAETVLSAHATAVLTGAEAGNGEVRYFGKAHFLIVYEDAEKRVCASPRLRRASPSRWITCPCAERVRAYS